MSAKSIKITKVEFPFSEAKHLNGRTFSSIEAANLAVRQATKPELGYYKTDFVITWEDGEQYQGRYDVGADSFNISAHVLDFQKMLLEWKDPQLAEMNKLLENREI